MTAVALAAIALVTFAGCAYGASARPSCADAVLDAWTRGVLDSSFSPECYEAAIDALPEDLRAYTTAADDISRVAISASREVADVTAEEDLSARKLASAPGEEDSLRAFPLPVVLLAPSVALLVASGLAASLIRRRRTR